MRKATRSQRGFTLIELVIVVTVIAILAVLLVPTIVDVMDRSRDRTARGTLINMQKAFARYQQDTGRWPEGPGSWDWRGVGMLNGELDSGFTALRVLPTDDASLTRCERGQTGVRCWNGPYLLQNLDEVRDPWGNRYRFYYLPPSADWAAVNDPSCIGCTNIAAELPTGALFLYSLGKDGLDATACEEPAMESCVVEPLNLIDAKPSVEGADDIIVVLSATAI